MPRNEPKRVSTVEPNRFVDFISHETKMREKLITLAATVAR